MFYDSKLRSTDRKIAYLNDSRVIDNIIFDHRALIGSAIELGCGGGQVISMLAFFPTIRVRIGTVNFSSVFQGSFQNCIFTIQCK